MVQSHASNKYYQVEKKRIDLCKAQEVMGFSADIQEYQLLSGAAYRNIKLPQFKQVLRRKAEKNRT